MTLIFTATIYVERFCCTNAISRVVDTLPRTHPTIVLENVDDSERQVDQEEKEQR